VLKLPERLDINPDVDHPDNDPPTLSWYEAVTPKTCKICNGSLGLIEHYDHDGGWLVDGFEKKQWLYRTCFKCGYQWAIWKLGVPR